MEHRLKNFADDVRRGLSPVRGKRLSSVWFYDQEGSRLFQEICKQPEYYLTRCEYEILEQQSSVITQTVVSAGNLNLVELGCGDGHKTKLLIAELLRTKAKIRYVPIDISLSALDKCSKSLAADFENLLIHPIAGDFGYGLEQLRFSERCNLALFLGSNIGNMEWDDAVAFLGSLSAALKSGDFLLIGFDLIKDPKNILEPAYLDKAGITAEFNRNLLRRINRELGGEFKPESFKHYAMFNFQKGAMQSFLYSTLEQDVNIKALGRSFHFGEYESIHTESSGKYTRAEIEKLALVSDFTIENHFFDSRRYFVDSLWRKK